MIREKFWELLREISIIVILVSSVWQMHRGYELRGIYALMLVLSLQLGRKG